MSRFGRRKRTFPASPLWTSHAQQRESLGKHVEKRCVTSLPDFPFYFVFRAGRLAHAVIGLEGLLFVSGQIGAMYMGNMIDLVTSGLADHAGIVRFRADHEEVYLLAELDLFSVAFAMVG